jgi:hypothetical protein
MACYDGVAEIRDLGTREARPGGLPRCIRPIVVFSVWKHALFSSLLCFEERAGSRKCYIPFLFSSRLQIVFPSH